LNEGLLEQSMQDSLGNWPTHKPAQPKYPILAPGRELAEFQLVEPLGEGGEGRVWRAYDRIGNRHVALKFLPDALAANTGEKVRIKSSFAHIHALAHQHICPVYGLREDEGVGLYLVMRFLEGHTLRCYVRERPREKKSLAVSEVIRLLSPVAAALDWAHKHHVVHRDVKPENIIVPIDGEDVQVIDFGLADEIRCSLARMSNALGEITGTFSYMAPEQWKARKCDGKADQYALGVVTYELLAGHLPFEGGVTVLRLAVLNDEPDEIEGIPSSANTALRKALAKDREARFATCAEFIKALRVENSDGELPDESAESNEAPPCNLHLDFSLPPAKGSKEEGMDRNLIRDFQIDDD
jgi:serine/threonine-protein kinase